MHSTHMRFGLSVVIVLGVLGCAATESNFINSGNTNVVKRIDSVDIVAEDGKEALVLHGQLKSKARAVRMAKAPESQLIIGTLSLLSEGIDLPHLSALIFASPVSDQQKLTETRRQQHD